MANPIIMLDDGTQLDLSKPEQTYSDAPQQIIPVDIEALQKRLDTTPSTGPNRAALDPLESAVYNGGHVLVKAGQGATALPRLVFAGAAGATNLALHNAAKVFDGIFGSDVEAGMGDFGFTKALEATDVFAPALAITSPVVGTATKLAGNVVETAAAIAAGPGGATLVRDAVVGGLAGGTAQTVGDVISQEDSSTIGNIANIIGAIGGPVAFASVVRKANALDSVRKITKGNYLVDNEVMRANNALSGTKLDVNYGSLRAAGDDLEASLDGLKAVATKPEELAAIEVIKQGRRAINEAAAKTEKEVTSVVDGVLKNGVDDALAAKLGSGPTAEINKLLSDVNNGKGFAVLNRVTGEVTPVATVEQAIADANRPGFAVLTPTEQVQYIVKTHTPVDLSAVDVTKVDAARTLLADMSKGLVGTEKGLSESVVSATAALTSGKPVAVSGVALTRESIGKTFVDTVTENIRKVNISGKNLYNDFIGAHGALELDKGTILAAIGEVELHPTLRAIAKETRDKLSPTSKATQIMQEFLNGTRPLSDDAQQAVMEIASNSGKYRVLDKHGIPQSAYLSKEDVVMAAKASNAVEKGHTIADTKRLIRDQLAVAAKKEAPATFEELEALRKQWGAHTTNMDQAVSGQAKRVYAAFKAAHEDAIRATGDATIIARYKATNSLISSSKKDAATLKELIGRLETRDTAEYGAVVNKIINNSKNGAETLRAIDRLIPESNQALKSKVYLSILNPNSDAKSAMKIWDQLSPESKDFYRLKFGDKFVDNYDKTMTGIKKAGIKFDESGAGYLPKMVGGHESMVGAPAMYAAHAMGVGMPILAAAAALRATPLLANLSATAIAASPALMKWSNKFGTNFAAMQQLTTPALDKWINAIGYTVRKNKDVDGARLLKALNDEKKSRQ